MDATDLFIDLVGVETRLYNAADAVGASRLRGRDQLGR